jgi:hypothetical protein
MLARGPTCDVFEDTVEEVEQSIQSKRRVLCFRGDRDGQMLCCVTYCTGVVGCAASIR